MSLQDTGNQQFLLKSHSQNEKFSISCPDLVKMYQSHDCDLCPKNFPTTSPLHLLAVIVLKIGTIPILLRQKMDCVGGVRKMAMFAYLQYNLHRE